MTIWHSQFWKFQVAQCFGKTAALLFECLCSHMIINTLIEDLPSGNAWPWGGPLSLLFNQSCSFVISFPFFKFLNNQSSFYHPATVIIFQMPPFFLVLLFVSLDLQSVSTANILLFRQSVFIFKVFFFESLFWCPICVAMIPNNINLIAIISLTLRLDVVASTSILNTVDLSIRFFATDKQR